MNQEELKQKIAEYFAKLPQEAQDVFSSMVWMEKLKEIIAKYNLNNEQTEILGTETTLVLLGIIHTEEYKEILQKELKLNDDITKNILSEIDSNILNEVKNNLDEAYEENTMDIIDPRFLSLPDEVKKAIVESDWKEKLFEIARGHKLNILQMGILDDVTVKLMAGSINGVQYEEELVKGITLAKEEVSRIVEEVNEKILKNIRGLMQKREEGEEKEVDSSKQEVVSSKETNEDIPLPPYKTIENKLNGVVKSEHTVTDYSNPKSPDPYREQI